MPVTEGEVLRLSIKWPAATSITNYSSKVYKNGTDYSSTVQLSGDSDSVNGQIQTAKKVTIKAGDFGQSYVVEFKADVDGQTEIRFWQLTIKRRGEEL